MSDNALPIASTVARQISKILWRLDGSQIDLTRLAFRVHPTDYISLLNEIGPIPGRVNFIKPEQLHLLGVLIVEDPKASRL